MITVSSRNNKRKILNHFYDNFRNGKNICDVADILLFISIKFDVNRSTKNRPTYSQERGHIIRIGLSL
jgi:hypothetical protein